MSMGPDKVITEARARVIWGESLAEVHEFLITNGVSAEDAQRWLRGFESERNRELRRIGLRNTVVGALLTGSAGVTLYFAWTVASATLGIVKVLAVVLLAGLYGLWLLVKGIVYLVRPQMEQRSIPDIIQSDPVE